MRIRAVQLPLILERLLMHPMVARMPPGATRIPAALIIPARRIHVAAIRAEAVTDAETKLF